MSTASTKVRHVVLLLLWGSLAAGGLYALSNPLGPLPPLGTLLDPADGLYRTARLAVHPPQDEVSIPQLEGVVTVVRDERGVPHIFAESDRDALMAMGYVVAQDRLFQLDFLPRVAAGRLSEVFGPASVETDRFLRQTGMEWGARKNVARLQQEGGLEQDIISWFAAGANAYIDALEEKDLPFEFRLLGYRPDRYSLLHAARLQQYFAYDLSYRSDVASYADLRSRLGDAAYEQLYPRFSELFVPIIPSANGEPSMATNEGAKPGEAAFSSAMAALAVQQEQLRGTVGEGFIPGKGSNNWVVSGARSATGAPVLAGDMHLQLTLPSIWYEVHLVTPTMNTYGVVTPGTPLPIEAFNDYLGWAFTNTGADVIDHYALTLDESGTRYRYQDGYRALDLVPDTIFVKGRPPVVDTLRYAHWGPVVTDGEGGAVALRWVAHEPSRTLRALWGMNHAKSYEAFQVALQYFEVPMQNIAYADREGNIAIRSTGRVPLRKGGHGVGLLDGATDAFAWDGWIPFEELPHALNPAQGYLTSTNQQPTDATYPYYLGHDWGSSYRSLRIDTLLRRKDQHSLEDLRGYQADVHAVQQDLFAPLFEDVPSLSERAATLQALLLAWDGETQVDRPEPLVLDELLDLLPALTWDEPAFEGLRWPSQAVLWSLLRNDPESVWLDVQATEARETAPDLMRLALEATADTLAQRYGWGEAHWRWGDHHKIEFRHLTQSGALRALWRGPFEYPGFAATLSPAGARTTRHSASWRVVVDFSETPPVGYGVYPGGQSGNPFSALYDAHVASYVAFEHYPLRKPRTPEDLAPLHVSSRLRLRPPE